MGKNRQESKKGSELYFKHKEKSAQSVKSVEKVWSVVCGLWFLVIKTLRPLCLCGEINFDPHHGVVLLTQKGGLTSISVSSRIS